MNGIVYMSLRTKKQNIIYGILVKEIDNDQKIKETYDYIFIKNEIMQLNEYNTFLGNLLQNDNRCIFYEKDPNKKLEKIETLNNCLIKMFMYRLPTVNQLDIVIEYYKRNPINIRRFDVFDELVKNRYMFDQFNVKKLNDIGYNNPNLIISVDDNNNNIKNKIDKIFMRELLNDSKNMYIKKREKLENIEIISADLVCYYINCIQHRKNTKKIQLNYLKIMLQKCSVDNKIYNYLFKTDFYHIITPELLHRIPPLLTQIDNIIKANQNILFLFILKNQGLKITEHQYFVFSNNYKKIEANIKTENIFSENDLDFLLQFKKDKTNELLIELDNFELFNYLDIDSDINTLMNCIVRNNRRLALGIMNNHKVHPTKKCLDLAVKENCIEIVMEIICYKIFPDKETIKCISKKNDNLIYQLCKHGLQFSLNDIELLLSKGIIIDDLSIVNIEYDETIYFMYYRYKCLTDNQLEKFTKISHIVGFRNMFLNKRVTDKGITKAMNKQDLHIDQYCIDNAYFVYNRKLIEYLKERYVFVPSLLSPDNPICYSLPKNLTPESMASPVKKKE